MILTALADLAPAGGERPLDVTAGNQPLAWLPDVDRAPRGRTTDRLAALDALHREERMLRQGIGFVLGVTTVDGATQKMRLPLLSRPVRLERGRGGYRVIPAGDLEITSLLADPVLAASLEAAPGLGDPGWPTAPGAQAWVRTVAEAAGLPVTAVSAGQPPKPPDNGLVAVTDAALFVARESARVGLRGTLLDWAARPGLDRTALAAVYGDADAPAGRGPDGDDTGDDVLSPLPLNRSQREVVRRARAETVTVVSGPPGNGKSHAVVAAALDVVERGGSVLIATQSPHAAAVLCGLLGRYQGPTPVAFGDAEQRAAIAVDLGGGTVVGVDDRALKAARADVTVARSRAAGLADSIRQVLRVEELAAAAPRWQPLVPVLAVDVPGAFEPATDLAAARARLTRADAATASGRGWLARWTSRRLRRKLRTGRNVPLDRVRTAIEAGEAVASAARLATTGGTDLGASWDALADADTALAGAAGVAMRHAAMSRHRWSGAGRRAAAGLAGALRAGRNRRRELLAALDGQALISALPLWVGTVTDVEDLLPPVPGLFDLVILDEASHIDQIRAAPVLVRARRAVVVGDPRQLRFVSFAADVDVTETLARHGLDDRVDVRRMSAYDLAVGAAPVTWLDEHYRSAPHLIEFSARRFYGERMTVATRHPRNDNTDVIDVVRVPDARVVDGVCRAEVEAVLATVGRLAGEGNSGIGVISPFRAQADALETALLGAYPVAEIERLGLRVGTVHAFQGSEASVIVASLGLAEGDNAGRTRFVADPNLFNVLVTRGRDRMVVVTGLVARDGIVGDYLTYSEHPSAPVPLRDVTSWPRALGTELTRLGRRVRPGYPVGPWTVDLCVDDPDGDGTSAVGLICEVHPDGIDAHVERQRELRRAGWRLVDAFASRWNADPVRAALDLAR